MDVLMGRGQKQRQTLAVRLIHKVCCVLHANLARLLLFRVYKLFPVLLSLCASHLNLSETTNLLSVGFFRLQTLQFTAQGDDLVGFCAYYFSLNCPFHQYSVWLFF